LFFFFNLLVKINFLLIFFLFLLSCFFISLLKPVLRDCFFKMIKGAGIGNEDIRNGTIVGKQARDLETLEKGEDVKWKAHQYCYSHPNWRKYTDLQSLMQQMCIYAHGENQSLKECVDENGPLETENRYYPTYQDVYDGWNQDVLYQIDLYDLHVDLKEIPKEELMDIYFKQIIIDITIVEERYESSKMEWFFTNKIVALSNVLAPKIFAKLLLQLWRSVMELSLNLLLPTQKSAGGNGIPYWNPSKGKRPTKLKKKKKKKKKKKHFLVRWGWRKDNNKDDAMDGITQQQEEDEMKSNNGTVQYLTRDEVYLMRSTHDFLLSKLDADGSLYGLKPALARRELGQEVVSLTEMWLDSGDVVSD
jgi:hypothetical protein